MTEQQKKKAIIYCRVSSKKQDDSGDGPRSQEHRCRQYAKEKGYIVEDDAVFHDAISGGGDFMQRPGMVAVLKYLKAHPQHDYVVIFDDLKRFARDTEFHIRLRKRLAAHNATVECLNFKFEETPEGKFVETVIAAQGELERHQISRQTLQKMKARLERGFSVFKAPIGYRYIESDGQGMLLVKDEVLAPIIQEALESYASGRFQQQAEVKRFLESFPEFPRDHRQEVRSQLVHDILTRCIYAGYLEYPEWGVSLRKAQHEALISFESYRRIQARLNGSANAPTRIDLDADFPLRGAVLCGCCGSPLTACWSRGRHGGEYPYYLCFKRECPDYRKSIRRSTIEGEFEALLKGIQPTEGIFRLGYVLFERAWNLRLAGFQVRAQSLKGELEKIDRDVKRLLDRLVETGSDAVAKAIEGRIRELETQRIVVSEEIARGGRPLRSFEETVRTALNFLANPWKLWSSDRLEEKRAVLKLAFQERPVYVRNEGFRTPDLALPFKLLGGFSAAQFEMASPRGFEPRSPP